MVNPGAFKGLRKAFLLAEKATYAAAVAGGFAADAVANIQRRYFKRFPVDLPHDVDPSQEQLDAVNDAEADPEPEPPDPERMTEEERQAATQILEERQKAISFRKAQIKRWLVYQYMKDQDTDSLDSNKENPYRILLHKLTGVGASRPRLKTASNLWRKEHRDDIEAEAQRRVNSLKEEKKRKLASTRQTVATEMYAALSEEEKSSWAKKAEDEHEEAKKEYEAAMNGPPSTAPAARQKCISSLSKFIQPILDGVTEATGGKCTLLWGGPEPAHQGRLNVIGIHSGTTTGPIKMNFGRAERDRYQKFIVPIFGDFLRKCYTAEECRTRALPDGEEIEPQDILELEKGGANFDFVPDADGTTSNVFNKPLQLSAGFHQRSSSPALHRATPNVVSSKATEPPSQPSNPAALNPSPTSEPCSSPHPTQHASTIDPPSLPEEQSMTVFDEPVAEERCLTSSATPGNLAAVATPDKQQEETTREEVALSMPGGSSTPEPPHQPVPPRESQACSRSSVPPFSLAPLPPVPYISMPNPCALATPAAPPSTLAYSCPSTSASVLPWRLRPVSDDLPRIPTPPWGSPPRPPSRYGSPLPSPRNSPEPQIHAPVSSSSSAAGAHQDTHSSSPVHSHVPGADESHTPPEPSAPQMEVHFTPRVTRLRARNAQQAQENASKRLRKKRPLTLHDANGMDGEQPAQKRRRSSRLTTGPKGC